MKHVSLRHLNLKWTFIIIFFIPLIITTTSLTFFNFQITKNEMNKHLEQQIELVARSIRKPVSQALQKRNWMELEDVLLSADEISRIYTVNLYDHMGELLWSSDKTKLPENQNMARISLSENKRKTEYTQINRQEVLSHFEPVITQKNTVVGLIQITRKKSNIENETAKSQQRILLYFTGAMILLLIMLMFLYNLFIRHPINHLATQLFSLKPDETNFDKKISVIGPKDFIIIEQAFNSVLRKIKSYERQLSQEQQKQIELRDKVKLSEKLAAIGTLAAGVAHDLGNPLSAIDATIQRMQRSGTITKEQEHYIYHLKNQTKKMESIIKQLLNYNENKNHHKEIGDITETVKSVVKQFQNREENIKYHLEIKNTVRPIYMDKLKVEQALINILSNALEAISKNTDAAIKIILEQDQEKTTISTHDTGSGIPIEETTKVLEPFYTRKQNNQNTNKGLGLAIVHQIVQAHQGELIIEDSSLLGGAKITITLSNKAYQHE